MLTVKKILRLEDGAVYMNPIDVFESKNRFCTLTIVVIWLKLETVLFERAQFLGFLKYNVIFFKTI